MDMISLFILRMHCCDAFSLSQSVLMVGSQEVACIWDSNPPATPTPPPPPTGDEAWWCTVGDDEEDPGLRAVLLEVPVMVPVVVTAARGVTTAVSGPVLLLLVYTGLDDSNNGEGAPLLAVRMCPGLWVLVRAGSRGALVWVLPPVLPPTTLPPLDSSPKLSAMSLGGL